MPHPLANSDSNRAPGFGPTVLVADDDPASRRFLCDGLRVLGARPEACSDGTAALDRARACAFDLLLLDFRMPRAGAMQVLVELHGSILAQSAGSVAIATSAELSSVDREKLLAVGFSDILMKPCGLADLQRVLALVDIGSPDKRLLDDQAALTASGDMTTMRALRLLLREELIVLQQELDPLSRDPAALRDRLHRLRSSCGFCGAAALSAQAVLLQGQLDRPESLPISLAGFRRSLSTTLQALDG
ncbi:MAG: response regulator [Pseudomonadota bacterium]|nr:response regulator [Pseudomonadota bacterium]